MDDLLKVTDSSNMLPIVKKGKCEGCNETAKDSEVLHCYLCKNYFHAANCTVRDTLDKDALPAFTNLTNYIKFSSQNFSTGTFIWTCFRCGVVKELASPENLSQRVAVLETLLMTLSPALVAITKSQGIVNEQDISEAISNIRANTPGDGNEGPTTATVGSPQSHAVVSPSLSPTDDAPPLTPTGGLFTQGNVGNRTSNHNTNMLSTASPVEEYAVIPPAPKSAGSAKIKVRVTSKNDSMPLRSCLHRAHSAGKIDNYSMRYHSNTRADLLFDNLTDAETAHRCASELEDIEVASPTCMKTKMVHIVGLTEEDTKDSVYKAICKPGRNRNIQHLVNPYTLRVLSLNPCKKSPHVYRASVVISEDIWDIILNKMNSKLKIDYLSCSVFLRPDSIRCYKCQRLGHTSQSCEKDITCVVCGEVGHNSKDCKNAVNCINCAELHMESSHRADSSNCAAYKNFRKGPASANN